MQYFTNLPLSWVYNDESWLDFFIKNNLNPELGFDAVSLGLSAPWHREVAKKIKDAGLCCSSHLPFLDGRAADQRLEVREKMRDQLKLAAEYAALYGAAHMVGHPAFEAEEDALPEVMFNSPALGFCPACQNPAALLPADPRPAPVWIKNSLDTWGAVLTVTDTPLFLENTYELSPEPVLSVIAALWHAYPQKQGQVGMCFDLGHWFSFACGRRRANLNYWLDECAPYLRHLHLHDNKGLKDEHLGLGQGKIPLEDVFGSLMERGLKPGFTMEPHSVEDLEASQSWIAANAVMQKWLNG